jgi:hypothetical protein
MCTTAQGTIMKLPAVQIDEEAAVEIIAGCIDVLAEKLTSDSARQVLRQHIRERLFRDEVIQRMRIIAAAEAGNRDADLALRELATEYISRRQEMPTELANYVQRALLKPPTTDHAGRNIADTYQRDIIIGLLVTLTAVRWQLSETRNRASKKPSAAYLVAIALSRKGIHVTEARVNKIVGSIQEVVAALSASIPIIDADDSAPKM